MALAILRLGARTYSFSSVTMRSLFLLLGSRDRRALPLAYGGIYALEEYGDAFVFCSSSRNDDTLLCRVLRIGELDEIDRIPIMI
jgi:hypothetical protein